MPVTVEVPANGEEGYQQYYVRNDLTEDKFIKGIEVRPGNRAAVHHAVIGTAQTDRTEIGFWFHDQPVQTEMIQKMVSGSGAFIAESTEVVAAEGQRRPRVPNIPPNAGDWKLVATTPFAEDITLFALAPHMHLRGKDMRYVLVRPDGLGGDALERAALRLQLAALL